MKQAIELTPNNCEEYLRGILLNLPFSNPKIFSVEEITEQTYVNWIFKAVIGTSNGDQIVYIRQSRDFVKKKPQIKMDPTRISFEVKILKLLQSIQHGIVPEVLYFDQENNAVILKDIRERLHLLVNELVKGNSHENTGELFGKIIARFHGKTIGISHAEVRGSEKENNAAVDFNLGMRLEPALKMFPKETNEFLEESRKAKQGIVLGDLASKNVFVGENKVRFLDLERSFVGDQAFDIAFLFCHYLLEIPSKDINKSLTFIENFMAGYRQEIENYLSKEEADQLENRILRFLGITILYRLFGFYLVIDTDSDNERWKKIAYDLLISKEKSITRGLIQHLST